MNTTWPKPRDLTAFERALLGQLKLEVESRASIQSLGRPHNYRRAFAVGIAAAATAVVVAFLSLTATTSPAYAVTSRDGNITVTITRLEDADGLEKELRSRGIEAKVNYSPDGQQAAAPPTPRSSVERDRNSGPAGADGPAQVNPDAAPGQGAGGTEDCRSDPDVATLVRDAKQWVLTIPSRSPLMDAPLEIGMDSSGNLSALAVRYRSSPEMPTGCEVPASS